MRPARSCRFPPPSFPVLATLLPAILLVTALPGTGTSARWMGDVSNVNWRNHYAW